ncbi:MAG: tripartite tricarboxylate transporter substrate binding protein [Bradyrhizobium sp.]|uniref:Bug family tripartite tricarboxylate transporter substrate binding protein n=1 Tax=Bradyrhizobium sp. TaxID=376 RepID=UPI001D9136C2|nr:tripartite tricarboxylate transporter substrate binding protein [Bradyrhizobium sp.]MBV9563813.1 tripartite tricarboxylate transporter substrate binding protein [Bradyrhizobium sp.]
MKRPNALRMAVTLLAAMATTSVDAGAYPDHPVRIVLPFGAGGVADVSARIVADRLGERLGQRFLIENMPGAGGITAAKSVISASPDGYTLGLVSNGTAISAALFKRLPFDAATDFEMISMLGSFDLVFAVDAASPYKTLADFITAAKAAPGKLDIGTVTVGSTQNLGAELLKSAAGIDVQIVPFRNSPDIVVGLLRNDVQMMLDFPAAVKGQVDDGKLRLLATSGVKRSPSMPSLVTAAESSVKDYEVTSWNGLFAPHGTPPAIIAQLNATLKEVLAEPDIKQRLNDLGIESRPSSPEELMALFKADVKKWDAVILKAGIEKK